jgi:magnesium transporter
MNTTVYKYDTFEWLDIENPSIQYLKTLEEPYSFDRNFIEDVLAKGHLPKIEKTKDYVFMILRAYKPSAKEKTIAVNEISNKVAFYIRKERLITIHRVPFKFLDNLPDQFSSPNALVLHLANEMMLTFEEPILTQSDKMDELEKSIFLSNENNLSVEHLYFEKSKARLIKKILFIMHDVINQYKVEAELQSNLQDLKDTVVDFILRIEEVVDDGNALLNTYMTYTAQKSNEVMKLLTVFSVFFLPLTFVAGIYGMNFRHMPEIHWEYGYFFSLLIMLIISACIYVWFKKKKIL